MSIEIFGMIIVAFIICSPIVFYISYIIQIHKQYKVFKNLSIGDEYDWVVRDIDDPFELPHIIHYKVTNKKVTADGWFVQLENKLSNLKKVVNIKDLIENYTKV